MKTLKYILSVILVSLLTVGCSLEEKNYTDVEKGQFLKNSKEAETLLLGVYRNMMTDPMYSYYLSLLFTLPTDQAKVEGSEIDNSWRAIAHNHFESSIGEVEETWRALYKAINDANNFIEKLSARIDNFDEADQKASVVYMGEARTLRALYYFELVRWFGNVALITSTEQSYQSPDTFEQAAPEEVYAFIEDDLKYAISVLPYATYDKAFRISKGSALGLLTKVYATWAGYPLKDETKWEEAAKTAKTLIESGHHGLLINYKDLWLNSANNIWDPTESLLEVSFFSPTITGVSALDPSGRIGKWNGITADERGFSKNSPKNEGRWRVLPTFLDQWEDYEKDVRWAISFTDIKKYGQDGVRVPYFVKDGQPGTFEIAKKLGFEDGARYRKEFMNNVTPGKWNIAELCKPGSVLNNKDMSNVNWYILRYADVLLLYAESLNEWLGQPVPEAYDAINLVRRRAGLDPLAGGMNQDDFRNAIRIERSHELAFEGHRKQDLIRWGIYAETMKDTRLNLATWYEDGPDWFPAGINTKKGQHELLPIPPRDLDLMPKFEQNPGWKIEK